MDISARALLVNTTVRVWTGEKRDRAITREICTMKGVKSLPIPTPFSRSILTPS